MTDERLTAFRDALRAGDTRAAVERFDAFDAAIDAQADRESALRSLASELVSRLPPTQPGHKAGQAFIEQVAAAEQARLETKYAFGLHVENGPDAASVADAADQVIETTEQVNDTSDQLRENADDVPVEFNPAYAVFGPGDQVVPLGSDISLSFTVENVGVTEVEPKSVEVNGYELAVSPERTPVLQPEETATITLTGTADERSEAPLTVQVGVETARVSLNVLAKQDFLENALTVLGTVRERLERIGDDADSGNGGNGNGGNGNGNGGNGGNGNGGNGNGNGGQPGLPGLVAKIEQAESRIEQLTTGNVRQVDKRIEAVIDLLGAFTNQVEGLSTQQLTNQDAAVLVSDADRAIETLETAIEAKSA